MADHYRLGTAQALPSSLTLNSESLQGWRARVCAELDGNILPYWREQMFDPRGGFYGGRENDGLLRNDLPRSAVLGARILWTFSHAAQTSERSADHAMAQHAWVWLRDKLWDRVHGGVYWSVDAQGEPLHDHKHSYAQGFAIYALAAYHRSTGAPEPLVLARTLFAQLDAAAHDVYHGGYFEGCSRDWQLLADARLSAKEPEAPKSMNTLLHVLEGFTELLRCGHDERLSARVRELIELFLDRIWQVNGQYFGLFFSPEWCSLTDRVSYGHDIETAWLLHRSAQVLGDRALLARVQALTVRVADAVLARGVASDGSVWAEGSPRGVHDTHRHWWCQAEGMLGFWDAYELQADPRHAQAAWACWRYIEQHHVDRQHGEWFKVLGDDGLPLTGQLKTGPWECPYHHARACLEMSERLQRFLER